MWSDYEFHVLKTQTTFFFSFKYTTHGVEGGKLLSSMVPPQYIGEKLSLVLVMTLEVHFR